MFKATILSSYLKEIVDALKVRSDYDILIHALPEGLRTRFVDPANVFMVDAKIPDTAFDEYSVKTELQMAFELSRLSTFVNPVDDYGLDGCDYIEMRIKDLLEMGLIIEPEEAGVE